MTNYSRELLRLAAVSILPVGTSVLLYLSGKGGRRNVRLPDNKKSIQTMEKDVPREEKKETRNSLDFQPEEIKVHEKKKKVKVPVVEDLPEVIHQGYFYDFIRRTRLTPSTHDVVHDFYKILKWSEIHDKRFYKMTLPIFDAMRKYQKSEEEDPEGVAELIEKMCILIEAFTENAHPNEFKEALFG